MKTMRTRLFDSQQWTYVALIAAVILFGVVAMTLMGCVSTKRYKRDVAAAFDNGQMICAGSAAEVAKLQEDKNRLIHQVSKDADVISELICTKDKKHTWVNGVCVDLYGK